jgi:hypothetical protein
LCHFLRWRWRHLLPLRGLLRWRHLLPLRGLLRWRHLASRRLAAGRLACGWVGLRRCGSVARRRSCVLALIFLAAGREAHRENCDERERE